MLTYDDLDHFDERTMAGLFDPAVAAREQASAQMRRERILACLHFCRDVPSGELPADGLQAARRLLRRALRNQQRDRRSPSAEAADFLEGTLRALGQPSARPGEPIEAASLRHEIEREIEQAARTRPPMGSAVPRLLELLACGDFELGAGSDFALIREAVRKFNGTADVEVQLMLDGWDGGAPALARIRLSIACGLWRWSASEGGSVAFDDGAPISLVPDDELLPVMLAGLSAQNGRAAMLWAAAVQLPAAELN